MDHRSAAATHARSATETARRIHVYPVRLELYPRDLAGIGERQISQHWALYEGYVANVNLLNERLAALSEASSFGPEFAALKRWAGFEYDGMVLHEHYFGVLKAGVKTLGEGAQLIKLMKKSFGGYGSWLAEFSAMGQMRGVGWVILYYNPATKELTNHWIGLHADGHPAGFAPLLVMDVWEHAYMVDAGVDGRGRYVETFLKNVDWAKLEAVTAGLTSGF